MHCVYHLSCQGQANPREDEKQKFSAFFSMVTQEDGVNFSSGDADSSIQNDLRNDYVLEQRFGRIILFV